jgi:hypothetical protein
VEQARDEPKVFKEYDMKATREALRAVRRALKVVPDAG